MPPMYMRVDPITSHQLSRKCEELMAAIHDAEQRYGDKIDLSRVRGCYNELADFFNKRMSVG